MSVLGPISTLQPARPAAYLDLDFSDGDAPHGLVYSRASNSGVWDRDGKYSVVGPNVPPITRVEELGSYALALEPARTNLLTTTGGRPVGVGPFSRFTQSPDPVGAYGILATGIDSPDGGNSAIRVLGRSPSETQSSQVSMPASQALVFTVYARKVGTSSSFAMRCRAQNPDNTTWVANQTQSSINLDTLELPSSPDPGVRYSARRVSRGYVEIRVCLDGTKTPTKIAEGATVGLYLGYTGGINSAVTGRPYFDIWYGQAESGYMGTSLILPAATPQVRSAYSLRTPINVPQEAGGQFDVLFDGYVDSGPNTIPGGVILWGVRDGVTSMHRMDVTASSPTDCNVFFQNVGGERVRSSSGVGKGPGIPVGRRPCRTTARCANGVSVGSSGGAAGTNIAVKSDWSGEQYQHAITAGAYQPNMLVIYLKRAAVFQLGSIMDLSRAANI
ncbi:MAG: hypothetical protein KER_03101 [Kerstersia gyiorum]